MELTLDIFPARRLVVRKIRNLEAKAAAVLATARKHGTIQVCVYCGGSVANKYGYPAETEGAVVIAHPDGRVLVRVRRLPANKVTDAGIVRVCLGGRSPWLAYFDSRCSVETWEIARPHAEREALADLADAAA